MMVLVTYDVNTETPAGRKRLRHVAKLCVDYGQRVQNSVFECSVTPAEFVDIKHRLTQIIDEKTDSIRFYLLGKNWQRRAETLGRSDSYDPDKGVLLL
ncbi:TPA: CRISPR-associated endonuclease Cas2 [Streptococcus pyogenes]|uniref:CRISPR-associated endonuclease Cas2 n=1 Tax=Streptococcus pyogenes TaxID=1314 RepID=UPI00132FFFCB|nr:CRISPR-associated endonuclease Cas2 [Streptococcus pyogenes]HER2325225.1 CRISPR-associated endonuclease Cas2 [Streptococcus pyogenes]HER7017187.1 CRISPR-associated endonuclease Cas2 [Streptococcus pyogenes]